MTCEDFFCDTDKTFKTFKIILFLFRNCFCFSSRMLSAAQNPRAADQHCAVKKLIFKKKKLIKFRKFICLVRNYIKLILVNCTQPIMISLDRHHISRFFFLILSLIFIPHHQIQFSAEYSINSRPRKFGHRQHHNL